MSPLFTPPIAADLRAVKAADETVNNSTTLQDDDALSLSLPASATFHVTALILYESTTTADFSSGFVLPAGATGVVWFSGFNTSGVTSTLANQAWAGAFSHGGSGAGTLRVIWFDGIVRTDGAGTFKYQWAQATQEVSDTKVLAGSFIKAERIR